MTICFFLRKRRVLLFIFLCSLTYFVVSTYKQLKIRVVEEEEDKVSRFKIDEILKTVKPSDLAKPKKGLIGNALGQGPVLNLLEQNVTGYIYKCRNSVQGRSIISDENGYVCDVFDVESNGCCNVKAKSTKRYSCDTCNNQGCCSRFENCVSCCLHPTKVVLLRKVLEKQGTNINRVYSLITNHFDLCLTKCRTSSESVQHENSYIDSSLKYCYGPNDLTKDLPQNKTRLNKLSRLHL